MKKQIIVSVALVFMFCGTTFSQGNFFVHAGPAFPLSSLADDEEGGAATGISLGGKYVYKLNNSGIGLYAGVDLSYNALKKDVKDDAREVFDYVGITVEKFFSYINVPVTAGLNYTYTANEDVALFAEAGLGVDFLTLTSMTLEMDGTRADYNFNVSTQLAYKLGGGLLIKDKFIVGLYYDGLGEHSVTGEVEFEDGSTEELEDLKQKVSLLRLTVGIKF